MRLWFLLFSVCVILFESAGLVWWRAFSSKRHDEIVDVIRAGLRPIEGMAKPVILVEPLPPKARGIARLLESVSPTAGDNTGWSLRQLAGLTLAAALAGLLLGSQLSGLIGIAAPVLGAIAGASVPVMFNNRKRRKSLAALEELFPEALDCLARSLRAGNALSVALELLCGETNEPLKAEIQKITRELTLGARLEDAINGLIVRVPLVEVRFFVSAVLLQRETGGNLSEVIAKLAESLRERFKLRGQVKAASGQGRITAAVLTALPVVTLVLLNFISPAYLHGLTEDPLGRNLLAAAVVFQVIGYLVMKRIINIEV
jgi:tight adherence protein B